MSLYRCTKCGYVENSALDEWERGALMAMSIMIRLHDQPAIAADVLREMGLENADCSGLDEYDKCSLRALRDEPRAGRLRGLGRGKGPHQR